MFRKYGLLGLLLIIITSMNFYFQIEPLATFYFPLIWYGYILTIDALVYKLRKESLISRPKQFFGLVLVSAFFWWFFEFSNISLKNWNYQGLGVLSENLTLRNLYGTIAFSTVLPALFETIELFKTLHLFDKAMLKKHFKISKSFLHFVTAFGIACFIAVVVFPKIAFPLIWLSFFLILDPINYLHRQPSIIGFLKQGKLSTPLTIAFSGLLLGFLWELWNYYAKIKWVYNIPYVGFLKIFEMPILGYLGYPFFGLELYSMYWFFRSLIIHKEHLLVE